MLPCTSADRSYAVVSDVIVGDDEEALVLVLQPHPVRQRTDVVAQMEIACRAITRKDAFSFHHVSVFVTSQVVRRLNLRQMRQRLLHLLLRERRSPPVRRRSTCRTTPMSKWPWPLRLNRMTFDSPDSLQASASSMAARMACADSGAGTMPSVRANCTAACEDRVLMVRPRLHAGPAAAAARRAAPCRGSAARRRGSPAARRCGPACTS